MLQTTAPSLALENPTSSGKDCGRCAEAFAGSGPLPRKLGEHSRPENLCTCTLLHAALLPLVSTLTTATWCPLSPLVLAPSFGFPTLPPDASQMQGPMGGGIGTISHWARRPGRSPRPRRLRCGLSSKNSRAASPRRLFVVRRPGLPSPEEVPSGWIYREGPAAAWQRPQAAFHDLS